MAWPTDEEVEKAVKGRPLYGSAITPYLLVEWNRHVGGDQPTADRWIEHVLPEKPVEEWSKTFSREQHDEMKDLLANLLPLSKPMNQSLGNASYTKKKNVYLDDSGFKATREFAKHYTEWSPANLVERSKLLTDWAISRWPWQG
ncbi:MAG: hypothetical protein JW395_2911 [Nitrospira sp.]|nr:hypothetical protein [Nitrospira sp.]